MIEETTFKQRLKEKIIDYASLARDLLVFVPFDLLTTGIRNRIPKVVKRVFPAVACRRYDYYSKEVICKPGERYAYEGLMEFCCRHYNAETGECERYAKEKGLENRAG